MLLGRAQGETPLLEPLYNQVNPTLTCITTIQENLKFRMLLHRFAI